MVPCYSQCIGGGLFIQYSCEVRASYSLVKLNFFIESQAQNRGSLNGQFRAALCAIPAFNILIIYASPQLISIPVCAWRVNKIKCIFHTQYNQSTIGTQWSTLACLATTFVNHNILVTARQLSNNTLFFLRIYLIIHNYISLKDNLTIVLNE